MYQKNRACGTQNGPQRPTRILLPFHVRTPSQNYRKPVRGARGEDNVVPIRVARRAAGSHGRAHQDRQRVDESPRRDAVEHQVWFWVDSSRNVILGPFFGTKRTVKESCT